MAPSSLKLRARLVAIAQLDVGEIETSRNHGPAIAKFWPATSYEDGYRDRQPYCAAAGCFWVKKWLLDPEVLSALNKTPSEAEAWRCKSALVFDWIPWAKKNNLLVLDDSPKNVLHLGDIMIFDMSHFGIVTDDYKNRVRTIEANTGASGGRDGDGIFEKDRPREIAKCFIRILP